MTAARRAAAKAGRGELSSVRFLKCTLFSGLQEIRCSEDIDMLVVPDEQDRVKNGEEAQVLVFKGSTAYAVEDLTTKMTGFRVSAYRFYYPAQATNSNWGLLGLAVTGPRDDSTEEETSTETAASSEASTETAASSEASTETTASSETSTETAASTNENLAESSSQTATESTEETTEEAGNNGQLAQSLSANGHDYTVVMTCSEEAAIPANASLQVTEIQKGSDEYDKYLKEASETLEMNKKADPTARFFDIKIMDGDQEIEPKAPVSVQITYDQPVELKEGDKLDAVHFGEKKTEVIDQVQIKTNRNDDVKSVTFDADSFSVYGLITYTVDFHWQVNGKNYEFSIPGGGYVSFAKLIEVLGISERAAAQGTDKANNDTEVQESDGVTDETLLQENEADASETDADKIDTDNLNFALFYT